MSFVTALCQWGTGASCLLNFEMDLQEEEPDVSRKKMFYSTVVLWGSLWKYEVEFD